MAEAEQAATESPETLKGITGWLLLPLLHLIVRPLYDIWMVIHVYRQLMESRPDRSPTAIALLTALMLSPFAAYSIWCLVRFLQERRSVPLLMTIFYGSNIIIAFWATSRFAPPALNLNPVALVSTVVVSFAMIAYFYNSLRVQNTFVVPSPPRKDPVGIGGMLLLPIGLMIFVAIAMCYGFVHFNAPAKMVLEASHAHWPALARLVGGTFFVGFTIFTLVSVFRKKTYSRWLMLGFNATIVAVAAATFLDPLPKNAVGAMITGFMAFGAAAYIALSKRVKNTFVR